MGMTIDEAIESLENMKSLVGSNHFAINMAIDTMHKYQKIKNMWDKWYLDMQVKSEIAMTELGEVLEEE